MTLKPKDNDKCPINEFIQFKSNAGKIITNNYGFKIKDGPRSPTFEITKPVE